MNIFAKVNKEVRKQAQPKTTVIEVLDYRIDKDPNKAFIKARDLLNIDPATGKPKEIDVYIATKSDSRIRGVKEYALQGNLVHTGIGGLIRLDRYSVRGNTYIAQHAQRIARDSSMIRQDGNGEKYRIAFDRAWVKVVPIIDRQNGGRPRVYVSGDQGRTTMNRGRAYVIPENIEPVVATLGSAMLLDQIKKAASDAYDIAPEKTNPFLLFRQKGSPVVMEVELPRAVQVAEGEYRPMTKDEMFEILPSVDKIATLLNESQQLESHEEAEIVPGYRMSVFGATVNERGEPIKGRVMEFAEATQRRFAKPTGEVDANGKEVVEIVAGQQEYSLSIFSYEIPQADNRIESHLATIGRVPGQKPSPNAGLSETPNPYFQNADEPEEAEIANQAEAPDVDDLTGDNPAVEAPSASALLDQVDDVDDEIAEIERALAGANLKF